MIRVTVNRDGIDKGTANPIRIERPGLLTADCAEAELRGNVRIVFRPDAPLADGTRVWIECDDARVIRYA